jgi:metal-responsive CopG/Arc/MetJ family transcriptional regulator
MEVTSMKVQISIDDALMAKVDEAADAMYTSRSGYITMALSQLIMQYQVVDSVKTMSLAIKKMADTGEIDDDTRHQLEDFERMVKMIIPTK